MSERVSINAPGFSHANPIPAASRIGPFVATGALTGRSPETGEMPGSLQEQAANAFHHLKTVMEAAGGSLESVLKLTVHLVDYRDRAALNQQWELAFPDPQARPARQVLAARLDSGALIHLDALAVIA